MASPLQCRDFRGTGAGSTSTGRKEHMTEATLDLIVQQERAERFRALHEHPPLVLANVWDART
ncbi:hypothetical protein GCM10010464_27260 [Pseudonocardia yunnanensis]